MNQKTLQSNYDKTVVLYKANETEEFFKRYLVEMGCREDRRQFNQPRPIKLVARNNSVVVSAGQTIVVATLQAQIQHITYSPLSQSYGQPLLKPKVTSSPFTRPHQNQPDRSIEQFITKHIDWKSVEDQLVGSDLSSGKQYGYKGQIKIRVLGEDGAVQEYSLLAVQILLWTCRLNTFIIHREQIQYGEPFVLKLSQFLFPFKYCYLAGIILADPLTSEEAHCDLLTSMLMDIASDSTVPKLIQHSNPHSRQSSQRVLKDILKLMAVQRQRVVGQFESMMALLSERKEVMLFSKAQK